MALTEVLAPAGRLRGRESSEGVSGFPGIPYALAPAGELRWRTPVRAPEAAGVRDCFDFGFSCWQSTKKILLPGQKPGMRTPKAPRPLRRSEDCLSLNVWTPAERAGESLPVMVWFYGGGLQRGTSDNPIFSGDSLCKYGVVLVTVNYRTGVFGYFGHPELEKESACGTSGNYGLADQLLSLRWVRDNIAAFGGDPGNVTIFGCSGGGRSVQGVCCSPEGRGLVRRAVCHSAGGLNPDYSLPYGKILEQGEEFTAFCGKRTVAELRALPAEELQRSYEEYKKEFNITGDGHFLPETMDEAVRRGGQEDIDYILSTTDDEIPFYTDVRGIEDFKKYPFGVRTSIFAAVSRPETDEEAVRFVRRAESYEMKSAQLAWAQTQAAQGKKPVYLCTAAQPMPDTGICGHGDDQYYLFHAFDRFNIPFTDADERFSREMMLRWTNFAKRGDPNGEGLAEWTRYTEASPLTMVLRADESRMEDRSEPVIERLAKAYREGRRE